MSKPYGRLRATGPQHEQLYQELVRLFGKHTGRLDAIEMLAVAANMVGKMIALQDQRKWTRDQVMEIVARNIEEGNIQAIEEIRGPSAGRA